MSLYDYQASKEIAAGDPPFASLIMAAMRQGDTGNQTLLRSGWPEIWAELQERCNSPGGLLPGELLAHLYGQFREGQEHYHEAPPA